jgi:predicted membrane-bound dolichyl-phosphate-mannose-protein mannosyltransferase
MVPLLATFLFSFDNLVFVQSRIGILDIFALTFMLLGLYWYFSGHSYLSAIGMALSALTKITGVAGFLIIVIVHAVRFTTGRSEHRNWSEFFSWFEKYFVIWLSCFLLLLTIMDRLWVGYSNPFDHIKYILDYSAGLVSQCPNGIISCPWQWLLNQVQIPYLVVNVQVTSGGASNSYASVKFLGAMNPAILYLTIPAMIYTAYSYYQKKNDLTLLALVWFAVTYLPYYPAVIIGQRVTYIFYFLATVPAICAAIAQMIADQNPPKLVLLFYLGVVLLAFFFMFPFKVIPT